jgi:phytoene/squalene synthetase
MQVVEPTAETHQEQHDQGDRPATSARTILENAYQRAEAATREYSKSFYLATSLLPRSERRAVRALYGFCRETDNLVDDQQDVPYTDLAWWREEANRFAALCSLSGSWGRAGADRRGRKRREWP